MAVTLVLGVGVVVFHTAMPQQLLGYLVAFVLAAAASFAVGLLIAAVAPAARQRRASARFCSSPMMFLAGLYFPGR